MKVKIDGVTYNVPDNASMDQIKEFVSLANTKQGIEEAQQVLPKALKAIELPASLSAYAGAKLSDITEGQAPLEYLGSQFKSLLGYNTEKKTAPKLTTEKDLSNILSLKAPDTSEYYQRSGLSPNVSKGLGFATDIATPLDLITLGGAMSKIGKNIGKGIYKYGLSPLGEISEEVPEMLYKANKWGSLHNPSKSIVGQKVFGQGGITQGLEDIATASNKKIGKAFSLADSAKSKINIGEIASSPEMKKQIKKIKEVTEISPELDWVDPVIDSEIKRKLDIGEKSLPIANAQRAELYKLAQSNNPKTFEGWLMQASGKSKPGSEHVGKVQKNVALGIRNSIADELDKIKSGLGDEYLKANKDLSNVYDVIKPLETIRKKGLNFSEYDTALILRVPQVVLAKKAFSLIRAPRATTGIGQMAKNIDYLVTGNPIMKYSLYNPASYGIRKFATAYPEEGVGRDNYYVSGQYIKDKFNKSE